MMNRSILLRVVLGLTTLGAMVSCSNLGTRTQEPKVVAEPEPAATPEEQQGKQVQDQIAAEATSKTKPASKLSDARQVQAQVMDFADEMTLRLAEAIDHIEGTTQSIEGRTVAHRLKYTVAHGATMIAAAHNPWISLVDMYVMIRIQRSLIESTIVPQYYGSEADRLVEVFRLSESEIAGLLRNSLTPEQVEVVDQTIEKWIDENPNRVYAGYVRLAEFSAARQVNSLQAEKERSGGLLGFLSIDPLAGLDPTTRELEQARLLAERAFFYMQRMPMLISWQTELLVMDTVSEPESRQVLENMRSLTESVQQVTNDVKELREQMPGIISSEREAVLEHLDETVDVQRQKSIEQALAGLSAEREALIEQLSQQEQELRPMINELRAAVESTTALSDSVRSTTAQFEQLAKLLRLDQPGDPSADSTDIRDFTEALRETTRAAQELVNLSESIMGTTAPDVLEARLDLIDQRITNAESVANQIVDRVYRRAIVVVLVLIAGLLAVVVVGAWLRSRTQHTPAA